MKHMALGLLSVAVTVFMSTSLLADTKTVEARPGAAFEIDVFDADNATAAILLLEGGEGKFRPGGNGFVSGQYKTFVEQGFTVGGLQAPADQLRKGKGLHPKFRETPAHASDIAAAVKMLQQYTGKPVWVLGVSRGTMSLANFVSRYPDTAAGAVFMSSTTRTPPGFKSVTDYDLSGVGVPVLAVAHEDDACRGTPPEGAREIAAAASASRNAKAIYFSGGNSPGRSPCKPRTPHVFYGIENDVVKAVASFIRDNSN